MIIDNNLAFDPAATALTTTRVSTNILDLNIGRDAGIGRPLRLFVLGSGNFAGGTSVNIQFQGAPETSLGSGTPGTFVTYAESGVQTLAQMNAVSAQNIDLFSIDVPGRQGTGNALSFPRFYQLNYVVVGTFTAGTIGAWIVLDQDSLPAYAPGIVVNN